MLRNGEGIDLTNVTEAFWEAEHFFQGEYMVRTSIIPGIIAALCITNEYLFSSIEYINTRRLIKKEDIFGEGIFLIEKFRFFAS